MGHAPLALSEGHHLKPPWTLTIGSRGTTEIVAERILNQAAKTYAGLSRGSLCPPEKSIVELNCSAHKYDHKYAQHAVQGAYVLCFTPPD